MTNETPANLPEAARSHQDESGCTVEEVRAMPSGEQAEAFDFYGGPFSNFAEVEITLPHPFDADVMVTYPSVEHFFQAMKAVSRDGHDYVAETPPKVRRVASGDGWVEIEQPDCWKAKSRGRQIDLRSDWEEVKYDVMVVGLREKFKVERFRKALLATGDRELREDSPTDFEWGYRNGGKNLLGLALMQVRDEIRAEVRHA